MFGKTLQKNNCNVVYASGDLVTTIAQIAINSALTNQTVVVGGEINMLVVLCHHFDKECHNIWFKSDEGKSNNTKLWNLERMDGILGERVMRGLIFMHVIMGSERTSHLFGLSTATALKKFNDS